MRFVHRILRSGRTASAVASDLPQHEVGRLSAVQQLVEENQSAKLVWLGEFHSERRIIEFQTELIREWRRRLPGDARLHVILEHFSVDMQTELDQYHRQNSTSNQGDEAFDLLLRQYARIGTEGHDLQPYRKLLTLCRDDEGIHLHGGFIPRPQAARLNKECSDTESRKLFFEEMARLRYLPQKSEVMHSALFADESNYKLRGRRSHEMLIQSLMQGTDLYSPFDGDRTNEVANDQEDSPMSRLYQAQLLKDHAMGFRLANIMIDHHQQSKNDRYLVIAGYGHLKHRLGVPDCLTEYLRAEAIQHPDQCRRAIAVDLLLGLSQLPITGSTSRRGSGSLLIGCQMMYEAYLEDHYSLLRDAIERSGGDDDEIEGLKHRMTKELFIRHPTYLDQLILKSDEIRCPLLSFSDGIAGFEYPCADYLFVYDEDDDNVITDEDLRDGMAKCQSKQAKGETREAYERVGETAGHRGNTTKARAIMGLLGYSEEDMSYIGDDDLHNFQGRWIFLEENPTTLRKPYNPHSPPTLPGVANPHHVANIQTGETVLDLGSGLGIDSFLALRDCGADNDDICSADDGLSAPFVLGVDLASNVSESRSMRRYLRDLNEISNRSPCCFRRSHMQIRGPLNEDTAQIESDLSKVISRSWARAYNRMVPSMLQSRTVHFASSLPSV